MYSNIIRYFLVIKNLAFMDEKPISELEISIRHCYALLDEMKRVGISNFCLIDLKRDFLAHLEK